MSDMTHAWHAQKSAHNYGVYLYLNLKSPDYVDWEVILLFYSACKMIDAYFIKNGYRKPENHMERNRMVRTILVKIAKEYGKLYDLSKTARYDADVDARARDEAVALHAYIACKLPDLDNSGT